MTSKPDFVTLVQDIAILIRVIWEILVKNEAHKDGSDKSRGVAYIRKNTGTCKCTWCLSS